MLTQSPFRTDRKMPIRHAQRMEADRKIVARRSVTRRDASGRIAACFEADSQAVFAASFL
jgi:hypothetical protein